MATATKTKPAAKAASAKKASPAPASKDFSLTSEMSIEQIEAYITQLNDKKAEIQNAERLPILEQTVANIKKYNFTPAELGIRAGSKKGATATGAPKAAKTKLIELPSKGKRPAGYQKGDILGSYAKPAFKEMQKAYGAKFEAELANHFTDEGKVYFKTPEGKAELDRFIEHTRTKSVGKGK